MLNLIGVCFLAGLLGIKAIDLPTQKYDGDQVFTVDVQSNDAWNSVLDILSKHIPVEEQDVWAEPRVGRKPAYIRLPSEYAEQVKKHFAKSDINFKVAIPDVQKLVEKSLAKNEAIKEDLRRSGRKDINGTFPRYDELLAWMEETVLSFPELASTFNIGETGEGRRMQILRLGLPGNNKWRVWIDAGLHAREWLAPTTAIFVANKLIEGYVNNDISIRAMLEMFDFDIMPVANPDGYEYCHTGDRLWRKNRRRINENCVGVDLNRNFGYAWGGVNADTDPCSNLYMGSSPESEIEVINIIRYILPEASKYLLYHAYHTWGELFFTRWDYTGDIVPPDHTELFDLASRAVNAINNVHGERYEAGTAPNLMYAFAGSSSDWARGIANIKYPFLTELRDYDGSYAFVAPPEEIAPCGEENWAGLQVILVELISKWTGTNPPME